MLTIRALTGGEGYAARHLSSNDYYSENEKVIGQWMGRGAEMLELAGEVKLEDFEAIRQGIDPQTGEFLRPRQSADRFNEQGEKTGTARSLYDFTVSAPKSVSVESMVDPRLVEAHAKAVAETAQEMERIAAARVRKHGLDENRTTGNLVIAAYQHDTSRELDPQIHTHLVAANLTYDGLEHRWKALQASGIYEQRAYLTEVYRNALAGYVMDLGYRIEDRFEEGRERGFEIVGMERQTLEKFSQRSEQRDQAIAQFTGQHGRAPTNAEIAVLVRGSRSDKLAEISTPEVKAKQWNRLTPDERTTLEQLHTQAQAQGPVREWTSAAVSLAHAREHLFERVSVARDYELELEALRHGRGRLQLEDLKAATIREEHRGGLLRAGNEVATQASLERERAMIETVHRGQGQYARLGGTEEFAVSDRLRPEQKHAVEAVLDSRDLAINLQGAAGTGKTATLAEIRRGLVEAGRPVLAVAPTRSAVEELERVGYSGAMTISRLLLDGRAHTQLRHGVLIVDEAGMVSSRQMSELLRLAETQRAQIVFSGDTRQIQSVEAGDALRILERESRLRTVSLQQVQRQSLAEYRNAVEELRQHPERGFSKLEQMGAVREVDWQLRPQEVTRAYRMAAQQLNAQGQASNVLIVAATHEEIRRITHAVRSERQRAGELGEKVSWTRHVPLHWTEAQKQNVKNFRPGMMLEFHKATRHVGKNEAIEVARVEKDKLIARKTTGEEVTLTRRQAQAFSVFEAKPIALAAGDKLLLEANRREAGLRITNGELVTVARLTQGQIELEDGRTLPGTYRQFDHGYAVTAHRSQGKTVDAVIVSGDRMSRELFYVAATRGRESLTLVTSNAAGFAESIGVSSQRQSASELAQRAEQEKALRMPGLAKSAGEPLDRDWVLHVASLSRSEGFQAESRTEQKLDEPLKEQKQEREIGHGYGLGF
jgi:conjugative relaxase-like TrwC/TraI family protein